MYRKALALLKAIGLDRTIPAVPFALTAALAASTRWPRGDTLVWVVVALAGAHTAARAFNHIADLDYDRENRRTADRALVRGEHGPRTFWGVCLIGAAVYFVAAGMLNRLCLTLSPLALGALLGYSYAKRRTVWTHWILGFCVGLAPVGAWIAVRPGMSLAPIVLGAAVLFWTAGFDIIFSCQDIAFYRSHRLFSLPARWGAQRALLVAAASHLLAVWLLVIFGEIAGLGWLYLLGVVLLVPALFWEHRALRPEDLRCAGSASLLANGIISLVLFVFAAADVVLISSRMPI